MFNDLLSINPEEEVKKITFFLKEIFKEQNIKNAVIGLSGGIDSAVTFALICKALPLENIFTYYLPYFDKTDSDIDKILSFINFPKTQFKIFSIKKLADNLINELHIPISDMVRRGNITARARMITLFDLAKKQNAMVVGTENRSEHFLGYFTRFGDAASDIEPIVHLYKTQVYKLASYLEIPNDVLTKKPSANLWEGQTDEGEIGFSYEQMDPVLYLYFDKHNSAYSIEQMFPGAKKIIEYADRFSYKLKVPYCL
jgi:NAD+ synthase